MPDDEKGGAQMKLALFGQRIRAGHALAEPIGDKMINVVRSAIWEAWEKGLDNGGQSVYPSIPLLDRKTVEPGKPDAPGNLRHEIYVGSDKKEAVSGQGLKTARDTVREEKEQGPTAGSETNSKYHILSPDGFPVTREPFKSQKDAEDYIPFYCNQLRYHGHFFTLDNERISLDDLPNHLTVVPEDRVPDSHGFRALKESGKDFGCKNTGQKPDGSDMKPRPEKDEPDLEPD